LFQLAAQKLTNLSNQGMHVNKYPIRKYPKGRGNNDNHNYYRD